MLTDRWILQSKVVTFDVERHEGQAGLLDTVLYGTATFKTDTACTVGHFLLVLQ